MNDIIFIKYCHCPKPWSEAPYMGFIQVPHPSHIEVCLRLITAIISGGFIQYVQLLMWQFQEQQIQKLV